MEICAVTAGLRAITREYATCPLCINNRLQLLADDKLTWVCVCVVSLAN